LRSREKSISLADNRTPAVPPVACRSTYPTSSNEDELLKTVMTAVSNSSIRVLEIPLHLMSSVQYIIGFQYTVPWFQKNSVVSVSKRTIPSERPPLLGEVNATFADTECHVVSAPDPHGR
jgi:hypothetical protein